MYIEIDHLCKRVVARDTDGVRRERVILDDITLSIDRGEFVCLLGFSGCGKSTLLNLLAGFDQPTSGRITVDGQPVTRPSSSRVMIFQQYGLLPWRTVEQNVMLGLEAQRLPRVDRQRLAEEHLRLVGLSDQAHNFPARLSGGQQQRVALARGLAVNPQVLFMDEPFAALDPITRHRLQDDLLRIVSERSKTVVFVTHDFDEAIKLGDWIVIFNVGGQIMQYDTPDQILANPANEFVEDFIGSGAGLRQLGLARVSAVKLKEAVRARPGEDTREVAKRIRDAGVRHAAVLDLKERPVGWVTPKQLLRTDRVKTKYSDEFPLVGASSSLDDALDAMLVAGSTEALVHGKRGRFLGLITVNTVIRAMEEISSKNPEDTPDAPMGHNAGASTEDADSEAVDSEDGSQASEGSQPVEAETPKADATPENSGEGV